MRVATALGEPEIQDLQDLKACGGWSRWARYVSVDGKRQDAAHCYVHPLLQDGQHPNLHLMVQTQVKRVLFDSKMRAVGVEFTPNPDFEVIHRLLVLQAALSRLRNWSLFLVADLAHL